MLKEKTAEQATLLDVLVAMFNKNEVLYGFHHRTLPLPDESLAVAKFSQLVDEATRWMGAPKRCVDTSGRRLVRWDDLEIRQSGRGILVRARTPAIYNWWHDHEIWSGGPLDDLYDWLLEDNS